MNIPETFDVCVVGTGAGGGLLAYELAMGSLSVVSIEQGPAIQDSYFTNGANPEQERHFGISPQMPWPPDPYRQFLYDNTQASRLYARAEERSTDAASEQAFVNHQIFRPNGKTNLWNGVCLRYSPRDFSGEGSPWPIDYEDLRDSYSAVEKLIGVCGTRENLENLPDGEFLPPMPLRAADKLFIHGAKRFAGAGVRAIPMRKAVETRKELSQACRQCGQCFHGCSTGSIYKFSSRLLPKIIHKPNYRIIYETKVLRLMRDRGSNRIIALECLNTKTGERLCVRAKAFVLAAGAMESPRILLNSTDGDFPGGFANRTGLVGSYLQDNISVSVGGSLLKLWGSKGEKEPGFGDNILIPRFQFDDGNFRGGYQAQCTSLILKRPAYVQGLAFLPGFMKKHVARLIFNSFANLHMEGRPEAMKSNRLVLSGQRDKFGIPQLKAIYEWTDNDKSMQQHMVEFGGYLKACSGVFVQQAVMKPGESIHSAGTCRMGKNPVEGVVDSNLKTFNHDNLYVADGSVFPQISEKNLSLTIMALAYRLAKHLVRQSSGVRLCTS